jgi:hypothetical protein
MNSDRDVISLFDFYQSDDFDAATVIKRYLHLSAAMSHVEKALADPENGCRLQFMLALSNSHEPRFEALIPDAFDEAPAVENYGALCDGVLALLRKYLEAAKAETAEELLTGHGIDASVAPDAHFGQLARSH